MSENETKPAVEEVANYLVQFKDGAKPDVTLLRGMGCEILREFTLVPIVVIRMSKRAAEALAANPQVSYVEPDGIVRAI